MKVKTNLRGGTDIDLETVCDYLGCPLEDCAYNILRSVHDIAPRCS